MKGWAAWVAILVIGGIAAVVVMLALNKGQDTQATPAAYEPAEAVEIVSAQEIQWQPTADLVGTVFSLRSVRLSNELPGRVTSVRFESGSIVEAGEVLLTLDDMTDQADLAAAEAGVRVAEANVAVGDARLALAESEMKRLQSAVASKAVSEMEVDRAAAELDEAKADRLRLIAAVDSAKAAVAQVNARLAKLSLRAPFRARVGIRNVHEGQYLPDGTEVASLEEDADRIYLDFAVPQEYLARISPGTTVMATSDALGPAPVKIEVVAIDATVNNDTRNVRVRSIVDNPEGRLRAGMFVQVRVPVDDLKPFTAVPLTAVRRTSYADHVFVVVPAENGQWRASQRIVRLGPTTGEQVIVLEGLEPGESVAAKGSFKLRDGMLVMRTTESATVPATTAAAAN